MSDDCDSSGWKLTLELLDGVMTISVAVIQTNCSFNVRSTSSCTIINTSLYTRMMRILRSQRPTGNHDTVVRLVANTCRCSTMQCSAVHANTLGLLADRNILAGCAEWGTRHISPYPLPASYPCPMYNSAYSLLV